MSLLQISLCVVLAVGEFGCNGSANVPPVPIIVTVSPASATVLAGGTQQVTAAVKNDSANEGVKWTISPATGAGTLSNITATSVTYNAPASAPANSVNVTITAISVADATKFASAEVNLPGAPGAVSVSVTPTTGTVQPGQTAQFTATVTNDTASAGVTWTVSCTSAVSGAYVDVPSCGTLSQAATPSGTPTTYTPPTFGDLTVTITAIAVTNSGAQASATVSVPGISIVISPASVTVAVGATQQFTAAVLNDSSNQGVTWALTYLQNGGLVPCPSATVCGTVSPASTASGAATTYTAPTSPPAGDLEVDIVATSVTNNAISTEGLQGFITIPGIGVSVSPASANVKAGDTAQLTATVSNDPSNNGVIWSVSCSAAPCGSVSPGTTASGVSTTYTAPPTPPPSDLKVTVTATSVTNSAASGSVCVTVPAISVSVTPSSLLIPLNVTQQFTATVGNDPKNRGVNWTLTDGGTPCSPGCGTVSSSTSSSGSPTTYTAPATMYSTATVTLSATSVSDATKSAAAAITISTGSVEIVPYSLNFGRVLVGRSSSQTITLTNTGSPLSIAGLVINGADPGDFSQTNTCNSSVGAGMACTVTAIFTPKKTGLRSGILSITDSSTDSPQQASLSGTGYTTVAKDQAAVRSTLASVAMVAAPIPTGPDVVGTRILRLVDLTREDPFVRDGTKRELLVRFWYPASLVEPCKLADYASPRVWSYFAQLARVHLPDVITNSCVDPPLADGPHPVVVFTPGYTGTFTDYTFIFEDLASRGYVVASVDHTYEATAVEFPDGRFLKSRLGSHLANTWRGDEATLAFASSVRLQDLEFVLTELQRLNTRATSPFEGKLDLARIAIAGHSAGGAIAFQAIERDPRFKAAVILDGYLSSSVIHPTQAPVLVLSAGKENASADHCRLWDSLRGPRVYVILTAAEHLTPSDAVWLAKGAIDTGSMGPERTIAAIRDYIAAFLDTNLRERSTDPLLTGPTLGYPDVVVTGRDESVCSPP